VEKHTHTYIYTQSPNSPDFRGEKKKIKNRQILQQVPAGSQNLRGFFKNSTFIFGHSQNWLDLL
jgi:hypothetical protein